MNNHLLLFLILLLGFCSCQKNVDSTDEKMFSFTIIPSPVKEGGEPNIFVSAHGEVYLSWVAYVNDTTDALQFSKLKGGQWSQPIPISQGSDWFVNWADFPSIAAFKGSSQYLAAHWLQKSGSGTYDYDVRIAQSKDGGHTWAPSFVPHTDGIPAEHGFVSLLPLDNGRMLAVWLDGRNTKTKEEQQTGHEHGGAMTLRTAEFDTSGLLYEAAELDTRICDCCQTDAALTANGPVVVYRDRSKNEIRDIAIVRKVNGAWTQPKVIHQDNWEIKGCPVNGPAITANDQFVAIAWFTGAEKNNQVKVILSYDAGTTFSEPILVDDGKPIGRVDIVLGSQETAVVSWLEETESGGEVRMAKVNQVGKLGKSITVVKTGVSRQSGFPILEKFDAKYLLAWTAADSLTTVKTLSFSLNQ